MGRGFSALSKNNKRNKIMALNYIDCKEYLLKSLESQNKHQFLRNSSRRGLLFIHFNPIWVGLFGVSFGSGGAESAPFFKTAIEFTIFTI